MTPETNPASTDVGVAFGRPVRLDASGTARDKTGPLDHALKCYDPSMARLGIGELIVVLIITVIVGLLIVRSEPK